jgi:hypothetical protein
VNSKNPQRKTKLRSTSRDAMIKLSAMVIRIKMIRNLNRGQLHIALYFQIFKVSNKNETKF